MTTILRLPALLLLPLAAACSQGSRALEPHLVQLDGGDGHVCGVDRAGTAWCWGDNARGQLGSGDSAASAVPVRVAGPAAFALVSAGYERTCGLDQGGGAWCWGENAAPPARGGLQALTERARAAPIPVEGAPALRALAVGAYHACGLDAEGRAWCWGDNLYGELGTGDPRPSHAPARLAERRFTALAAGRGHTCGLDAAGVAWCWGDNQFGQLGDGGRSSRAVPGAVVGEARFRAITAGAYHTCGLGRDGRAWCWGNDDDGQIGAFAPACGARRCAPRPLPVIGGLRFHSLDAGPRHTCGVADGRAWCWGQRWTGSDADGRPPVRAGGDDAVVALGAAGSETCAVTRLGRAECFGRASDPARTLTLLAVAGGIALALLIFSWERRLVPTLVFLVPVGAILAAWVVMMRSLLGFWIVLRQDETGWFFILEIFVLLLAMAMLAALLALLATVARAWRRRRAV